MRIIIAVIGVLNCFGVPEFCIMFCCAAERFMNYVAKREEQAYWNQGY